MCIMANTDRTTAADLRIFLEAFVCECDDPKIFITVREMTGVFNRWRRERDGGRTRLATVVQMGRVLSAEGIPTARCWRRDVQEQAMGVRGWFWAPEAKPYLN